MFQIGIDGFILSQSAELLRPVNEADEAMLRSCAYSYRRCLEDLAFALVYADKVLKYGELRPAEDPGKNKVRHLLDEIHRRDSGILGEFKVDEDIHGDQLLKNEDHRAAISHDLRLLEKAVRSTSSQCRFKEWLAREAAVYFGDKACVFREEPNPADYQFATTVPYHEDRPIQDSIPKDVVTLLNSALPDTPKTVWQAYSDGARREFIARNMLTLVTIMRAYELSAARRGLLRLPHVTRAWVRFLGLGNRSESQIDLRDIVVRHALHAALTETGINSRESLIKNLCKLRNEEPFKTVREVLGNADLLVLNGEQAKEKAARDLIDEIKGLSRIKEPSERDAFTIEQSSALREFAKTNVPMYKELLFGVFPELNTAHACETVFIPPPSPGHEEQDIERKRVADGVRTAFRTHPPFHNLTAATTSEEVLQMIKTWLPARVQEIGHQAFPEVIENPRDSGVDILLEVSAPDCRLGFQVKGPKEIQKTSKESLEATIKRQIQESHRYRLDHIFIVLAADVTHPPSVFKARGVLSSLAQMNDPYVIPIPPEDLSGLPEASSAGIPAPSRIRRP